MRKCTQTSPRLLKRTQKALSKVQMVTGEQLLLMLMKIERSKLKEIGIGVSTSLGEGFENAIVMELKEDFLVLHSTIKEAAENA